MVRRETKDPDDAFRRMVIFSAVGHLLIFVAFSFYQRIFQPKPLMPMPTGSLNVMWAKTVSSPKKTPAYKLPGPIVQPKIEKPKAEPKKKVVLNDKKDAKAISKKPEPKKADEKLEKESREEERRRKLMEQALAGISSEVENRPAPKADNFPSAGEGDVGPLASPLGGGMGGLTGDPEFMAYQRQVQDLITGNFVWLRAEKNLEAQITFEIDRSGSILTPKIQKSSGNGSFDQAALRAVRKSSPLPRPGEKILNVIVGQAFVITFNPRDSL